MTNARLEELRTKFQENPRRYFAPFANELRKSGDAAQAIAICRTHLIGQPGHVSGHIVLGQALYEAGEGDEARGMFVAALELDPENLIALRTLGEIAQVKGEFASARQWYERLLDADPRNSEVVQLLKDIPVESPSPTESFAAPAPVEVEEVGTQPEVPAPAVPEASPFHTTYTGVARAYEPREPLPASPPEALFEIPAEASPASVFTHAEPVAESVGSFETVDLDSFPGDEPVAIPETSVPGEAMPPVLEAPAPEPVVSFEAFHTDDSYQPPVQALPGLEVYESASHLQVPPAAEEFDRSPSEARAETAAEPEAPESYEPPKAVFAEHGFEGPVDDEVGWVAPPSAAYSDLEAAPEDWFAEPALPAAEAEVANGPMVDWTVPSQPEPPEDSWFDEAAGVSEPVMETGAEESWMPDFAGVAGQPPTEHPPVAESFEETPDASTPVRFEPAEAEAESAPDMADATFSPAAAYETPELVAATPAVPDESWKEGPAFEPQSFSEAAEEAVFVEHHDGAAAEATAPAADGEFPFAAGFVADPAGTHNEEESEAAAMSPGDAWVEAASGDLAFPERHGQEGEAELVQASTRDQEIEAALTSADHAGPGPVSAELERVESGFEPAVEPVEASASFQHEELVAAAIEFPDPAVGRTPSFTAAIPLSAPAPAPFVTETLAELYLQQGFREEALAIYQQLLERNPADQSLKARIEAVEGGDASDVVHAADVSDASRPPSESVRSFFGRLARRAPVDGGHAPPPPAPQPPASHEPPFANAASALASLFAASKPPVADERAASTLSGAYSDPAGRPSRAAERELSLDHLFREVPPGGAPAAEVTLDEFYASGTAESAATPQPGDAGAPDEGATDIRQFTAWLEGLRKK